MHFKVKDLKAFVDQEFQDVQFEAEDLLEGWREHIWPQAMQFHGMIQRQAGVKTDDEEDDDKQADKKKKKSISSDASKKAAIQKAPMSKDEVESTAVAEGVSPEVIRAREAEKMAKQLMDEETKEQKKKNKGKK